MSDRSFIRFGGLCGILLALSSWAAVVVFFVMAPAAQQQVPPIGDVAGYVTSLQQNSTGTLLFTGLYALIAFWAIGAAVGAYYVVRQAGEAWAFFGTVVGAIAAVGWFITGLAQLANLRYILAVPAAQAIDVARPLLAGPLAVNPFNVMTGGLTSIPFGVAGLLILRTPGMPKLLGYLGVVCFADLVVGFLATVAGVAVVPTITAAIAGGFGGPVFWLWLGVLVRRSAEMTRERATAVHSPA